MKVIHKIINPDVRGRIFTQNHHYNYRSAFALIHRESGDMIMDFGTLEDCIKSVNILVTQHNLPDQKVSLQMFTIQGNILHNSFIVL
ncbi:hypothetical protein [Aquimarina sp. RZ0]|uniref:hypothetical protein n=1 Tax=Aquimarina sp. RZ0 TaxID=2607730 RepID=UPI0011F18AC0|nr:hypothetical protein [Aquimarina sp. RZ0]KAA1244512.1 hypothetical protein F0000_16120 [Aquimarina sp. RZ0]